METPCTHSHWFVDSQYFVRGQVSRIVTRECRDCGKTHRQTYDLAGKRVKNATDEKEVWLAAGGLP